MLSADATDNSSSPMLFDSDGLYADDYLDNFSIDIGDLYAILDEDPQQQPNSNNSTVSASLSLSLSLCSSSVILMSYCDHHCLIGLIWGW